jgi:Tfp pilus assembly protein PilF
MVRLRRSAVLALVASFVAAGLWADAQGRLQATVVDENGNPVADATVTITSDEIGYHRDFTTDKKGRFSVIFVDATRTYTLKFSKQGFANHQQPFKPAVGENLREEFTFPTRAAAAPAPAPGAAVDSRNPAINLFNEGVTAVQAGDLATAKQKFLEASQKDPSLAEPFSALAGIHLEEKDYAEAEAMAAKVLAIDSTNSRALRILYDIYHARGETAKADETLAKLKQYEKGTDTAIRVFNEGAEAARVGDLAAARSRFEEALQVDPELAPAHAALSTIYLAQKEYDKAIAAADAALAIDPGRSEVLKIKYESYRQLGDEAKAREVFAEMVEQDPAGTAGALFKRGIERFNASDMPGATTAFEQALAADPSHAKAHYMLGLCYVNTGENAKAKEKLTRFLELAPDDPDAATAQEMLKFIG